jgi:hypothetical protein
MRKTALFAFIVFTTSSAAQAALIELVPSSSTVNLSDLFDFELQISGLGDGVAPSVGTYDINIFFDSSILQSNAVTFGDPLLGNQLDIFGFGSIQSVTPIAGGLNLFELSLDLASDLDDFQAPAFTLATLTFQAIGVGVSAVTPDVLALGDALGEPLEFQAAGPSVTVIPDTQQIPEPNVTMLVFAAIVTMCGFRRVHTPADARFDRH